MYCSRCGAQAAEGLPFCAQCGAPMGAEVGQATLQRVRPALVTLLAVLKLVGAFVWLVLGVVLVFTGLRSPAEGGALPFGVAFLLFGGLAALCGYGLWTLRSYGRYLQIAFSFLGLIGFPLQTIISILILIYVFKPGVRVLFSGTPIGSLGPVEREQLRSLQAPGAAGVVVAIAVAIPVMLVIMGIVAAIAIPNLLNAVDRGKQKRTMADLRSIATAVEAYAADHREYPTATSMTGLQALLEPEYIGKVPTVDGWGHAFGVDSTATGYALYSPGKDGSGSDCSPGTTTRFNDEICFVDGQFTRYPEWAQW